MSPGAIAALVTSISGALFGFVALLRAGRVEQQKTRIDDTNTAFEALSSTVDALDGEIKRLRDELAAARADVEVAQREARECDQARRSMAVTLRVANGKIERLERTVTQLAEGHPPT